MEQELLIPSHLNDLLKIKGFVSFLRSINDLTNKAVNNRNSYTDAYSINVLLDLWIDKIIEIKRNKN